MVCTRCYVFPNYGYRNFLSTSPIIAPVRMHRPVRLFTHYPFSSLPHFCFSVYACLSFPLFLFLFLSLFHLSFSIISKLQPGCTLLLWRLVNCLCFLAHLLLPPSVHPASWPPPSSAPSAPLLDSLSPHLPPEFNSRLLIDRLYTPVHPAVPTECTTLASFLSHSLTHPFSPFSH